MARTRFLLKQQVEDWLRRFPTMSHLNDRIIIYWASENEKLPEKTSNDSKHVWHSYQSPVFPAYALHVSRNAPPQSILLPPIPSVSAYPYHLPQSTPVLPNSCGSLVELAVPRHRIVPNGPRLSKHVLLRRCDLHCIVT